MRRSGAFLVAVLMLAASSVTVGSAAQVTFAAAEAEACCDISCAMPHAALATRCCAVPAANAATPLARDGASPSRTPLMYRTAAAAVADIRVGSRRVATTIDSSPPPLIVPLERLCSLQI